MPGTDDLHPLASPKPRSRVSRPVETILLASTACLLAAVAWPIAMGGFDRSAQAAQEAVVAPSEDTPVSSVNANVDAPTIQIALLLDTSSSMDGLIDQARSQLWSVVNTLDGATFHGAQPQLEIAVYEYGNDTIPSEKGWVRKVQSFTSELDSVSEALFTLTTNGGTEHAGEAIGRSLEELEWRSGEGVLKIVYVAGNEGFQQGPVPYGQAIANAKEKGVVVNTIFCGNTDDSDADAWRNATTLSGGRFATINHNQVVEYIAAPQDEQIALLGGQINETYIRYGIDGRAGLDNLVRQDKNMAVYGAGSVVGRSVSKSSGMYRNDSWDLVDAVEGDKVDYAEVDRSNLPGALQNYDDAELKAHVEAQQSRRVELQAKVAELGKEREAYITAVRARKSGDDPNNLDQAIIGAIRQQATAAGFTLDAS